MNFENYIVPTSGIETEKITSPITAKESSETPSTTNFVCKDCSYNGKEENLSIKHKMVWLGPAGGYVLMEENPPNRKVLDRELTNPLYCRVVQHKALVLDHRTGNNEANTLSTVVSEKLDNTTNLESYKEREGSLNFSWREEESVQPLPYQDIGPIGNRSKLARNLVPLTTVRDIYKQSQSPRNYCK
ncbi:uncharacterized protein CMU_010580 [Cryptosporidium muris RN66]|uniref:Uncharacterized protein n=1 Tax=Cryptosporidium muris (strain RN66) TaxID=441375 RepID=B6AIR9_CRYMR|nr:uncharacterized protein CMU_010580 [Cryptosporidium muris RN66]EEA08110.1 hypothetical protein CMU_010580 [Cryptosporidium muris RN66]|eukprot:XP_002142459.1 hypothetical protein [Cryptosporidium muris RN66]